MAGYNCSSGPAKAGRSVAAGVAGVEALMVVTSWGAGPDAPGLGGPLPACRRV